MEKIKINSVKENTYVYDDITGLIYLDNDGSLDLKKYDVYNNSAKKINFDNCNKFTEKDILDYLFGMGKGFNQVIFEMTSQCNLRCKYCIYSEEYIFTKKYEDSHMTFETAKKGLDLYFENFGKIFLRNPNKKASIGFYGGEPLMNFKTIKQMVEYTNATYGSKFEILYSVTTNGLLMKNDVIDFLVENNFAITFSIDGDKENHDRNRVRVDGSGSHEEIMKNLNILRTKYPSYERIAISSCYDFKTDFLKLEKFFDENKLFLSKLAPIDPNSTTYYNQFSEEERDLFESNLKIIKEKYFDYLKNNKLKKDSFLYAFVGVMLSELSLHPIMAEEKPWFIPKTSCCVPGEKIYVTNDGKVHMCEKINSNFPIGDVDNGLDYGKICTIIRDYNNNVCKNNCESCRVSRLCTLCYAQVAQKDNFEVNKIYCSIKVSDIKDIFKEYVEILEEVPDTLDDITVGYYKEIFHRAGELNE